MSTKTLSVRIDEELVRKLHIASAHEGRSASGQAGILIRHFVSAYEKQHPELFRTGNSPVAPGNC